jgi:hypothetical protein
MKAQTTKTITSHPFGYFTTENGNSEFFFNNLELLEFLSESFFLKKAMINEEFILIQQKGNLITKISVIQLLDIFHNFLKSTDTCQDDKIKNGKQIILQSYVNNYKKFNDKSFYNNLPTLEITPIVDTPDTSYTFFRNGIVTVTKSSINFEKYEDSFIDGHIWRDVVIDRDFEFSDEKSETEIFAKNITKKEDKGLSEQNYTNLQWATGYLMHNYSGELAIVLTDEKMGESLSDANGRCGKSLWRKIMATVKNLSTVNGKEFDANSSFTWQSVRENAKIVCIDDVKPSFKFDDIFTIINEGFEINKKYAKPFEMMGLHRPKIMVGTNYAIGGVGSSYNARQFLLEFGSFYNENHTPVNDFGHYLIDQWDSKEFVKSDNFLMKCIQIYLRNTKKPSQLAINNEEKKLQVRLGSGFIDHYQPDNLARLVSISKFDGGIYLKNEYENAQKLQIVDKECSYESFIKKITTIMSYYKVVILENKRKRTPSGQVRVCMFDVDHNTNQELLKELQLLNPEQNLKSYIQSEQTGIVGWDITDEGVL